MGAISSPVELVNLALDRLNAEIITSFSDDLEAARKASRNYDPQRRATLRAHPWNFALLRATLSPTVITPTYEFSNFFPLPADCLRVVSTSIDDYHSSRMWKIEGKKLLANVGSLNIRYIADIEDTAIFDTMFIDVFTLRLASALAFPLTGDRELGKALFEEYLLKVAEARSIDAQESSIDEWNDGTWLDARY